MSALGASQPELSRTEAYLVDAARDGDERAFGELYERYGRRIFAYVLGMVSDHGRAEDIVQEVFVSALRRMRSSDRPISFKPWIYEIAKNACIDEFRRAARSREVSLEHGTGEHLVAAEPAPDTCFERGQQLAMLHGAFRGLSERQHKVMVLRELEGLSYGEIAVRTGMTVPMVESTLLRARRRLSQEYDDIASGRRCQQVHAVIDTGGQAAVDALGARERRRFARHVAHCQPCAWYVHTAGVIAPETGLPAVAKKIAGFLPFPFARWSSRGGHAGSGSHASGLLRSARRAAQFVQPSASIGASPATVATMAAAVIAGGGAAAVGLLAPWHTSGVHGTPAAVIARPTAATRAVNAPRHRVSRSLGRAAPAAGYAGHPAPRSTAARPTRPHSGAASTRSAQPPTSGGSTTTSTHPSAPRTPTSTTPTSIPSPRSVHLPIPLPPLPPQAKHLVHKLTTPLTKVIKDLHLPLPGGLGLPNLPNNPLGAIGG